MSNSNVIQLPNQFGNFEPPRPAWEPRPTLFLTDAEVLALPREQPLVRGLIPIRKGIGAIYGPPGSGKSFVLQCALSTMANVTAQGEHYWFGYRLREPVNVLQVPFEGLGGIPKRIAAWRQKHGKSTGCRYVMHKLNLADKVQFDRFCLDLNKQGFGKGVIGLDTLAAAFPGINENDSEGMGGIVIERANTLADRFESIIWVVHHTGKNLAAGLRGWSGLEGAVDFNIECTREGKSNEREFQVVKLKDGGDGAAHKFHLETVEVWKDQYGEAETSCVVVPGHGKDSATGQENVDAAKLAAGLLNAQDNKLVWTWIYEAMASGKVSAEALDAKRNELAPGMTQQRLRDAVTRLIDSQRVTREGKGRASKLCAHEQTPGGGY